jgi:hypothetical protein
MGSGALSNGSGDDQPTPSFASPNEQNATITFNATALDEANVPVKAKIYVGQYEARATPIADTDTGTPLSATAKFVPGTYDFVAQAPGYGLMRFTQTFSAGQATTVNVAMPTNWASSSKSASAAGDGTNQGNLIDDTEGTQWESTTAPVAAKRVTVTLNGPHVIRRVQVSAMIQAGQSRFSALRKFELWACTGSVVAGNCSTALTRVYQSASDAFPGVAPRPVAPNLIMRSFTLPTAVTATQVQLRVDTSQCTGGPAYAGVQDSDPVNEPTDCTAGGPSNEVRAAELEVFSGTGTAASAGCTLGYPYSSSNPRTSVTFNENEVLRTFGVFGTGPNQHLALFYNDEHAMTLGVNPDPDGTPVSTMPSNPGHVSNPDVGDTTAADPSKRPEFPAAFVSEITNNPNNRSGDWQQQTSNTSAMSPSDIFGTWKAATKSSTGAITPGADPAKNNWNLGPGADPVPTTNGALPTNEGYSAEANWSFAQLGLRSGKLYRIEFMVHDGDQTGTGGDSGEACINIAVS